MKREAKYPVGAIKGEFSHPATILWRAIEVAAAQEAVREFSLQGPILDLGCAEGKIGGILFKDKRVFGLDNCWELLSKNKGIDTYRALVLADACKMPFKRGALGCVFSNSVIEHIPDLGALLEGVKDVLKEKGLFIFTVPSDKFGEYLFFSNIFSGLKLGGLAKKYKVARNKWLNHFHCYGHKAWEEKLGQKGLRIIGHSYYISKRQAMAWDFMAALVLVADKIKCSGLVRCFLGPYTNRIANEPPAEKGSGAGLLIVAQKI